MTTASGTREIPFTRRDVWRALTVLTPYCPVCDVSYVFSGAAGETQTLRHDDEGPEAGPTMGKGTSFVCWRGRLDGEPPLDAVRGEVVEWVAQQSIGTRLELAPERWQTRIELADADEGSTRVTVTVTHEPKGRKRLLYSLRRRSMQRLVQGTVTSELVKLPDHIRGVSEDRGGSIPVVPTASSVEQERAGWVVHLRGEMDTPALTRLGLRRCLEDLPVLAIDVRELTYLDSSAFPAIRRWAKRSSRPGGHAVIRGENPYFDQMLAVMGLTSVFHRES